MLVLSRKLEETIVIDGKITITVLQLKKQGIVKLGIVAPSDVRVMRSELLAKVAAGNITQTLPVEEETVSLAAPQEKQETSDTAI